MPPHQQCLQRELGSFGQGRTSIPTQVDALVNQFQNSSHILTFTTATPSTVEQLYLQHMYKY